MNSRRRLGLPLLLRFRRAETITFRRVTPLVHHSKFGGQCLRWVNDATLLAIRDQERAGLDIITDGEAPSYPLRDIDIALTIFRKR